MEKRLSYGLSRRAALALALLALGIATVLPSQRAHGATSVAVAVDATVSLGAIPETAYGMNEGVWDYNMLNPVANGLMQQAGMTLMRMPGGSTADGYHWENDSFNTTASTASNSPPQCCGYIRPGNTYTAAVETAKAYGMQPFITVNYGSTASNTAGGDPIADGANWVYDANVIHRYGVKYWEIGNETYGSGYYDDSNWETNLRANRTPDQYAADAVAYSRAMKNVDPSIKVGLALETPGYYPWGAGTSSYAGQGPGGEDWNSHVLQGGCQAIDFVDVHWYPTYSDGTDAALLSAPSTLAAPRQPGAFIGIKGQMDELRREIGAFCGPRAAHIQIFIGESNTGNTTVQRTNIATALFASDEMLTWLENGVANVSWWDLHNGLEPSTPAPGIGVTHDAYNVSDIGVLSSGSGQPCAPSPSSTSCEPPVDTPFPAYYGLRMAALTGRPGDTMVAATSDAASVAVHAVRQANGNLAVLLVNKDPNRAERVQLSLTGYAPAATATTYSYGDAQAIAHAAIVTGTMSGAGASFAQNVPPYTMMTLVLSPSQTTTPAATATTTPVPPTATVTSTNTPTAPTDTDPPTATATHTPAPSTATDTAPSTATDTAPPTSTNTPPATSTNTPPATSTNTPPATSTNTPPATSTNTPPATSTNTPVPPTATVTSTNTPTATDTAPPTATDTAPPTATDTAPPTATDTAPPTTRPPSPSMTPVIAISGGTVSPSRVSPGTSVDLSASVSSETGLSCTVVDFYIVDVADHLATQRWQPCVDLSGAPRTIHTQWTVPTGQSPGSYTMRVGVFNSAWSHLYRWDDNAVSLTIAVSSPPPSTPPAPSPSTNTPTDAPVLATPMAPSTNTPPAPSTNTPTVKPAVAATAIGTLSMDIGAGSVKPGNAYPGARIDLAAMIASNHGIPNTVVDFYVYAADGSMVAQLYQNAGAFNAGARRAVRATWVVSRGQASGTYTIKLGVFSPDWSRLYVWDNNLASLTVASSYGTVHRRSATRHPPVTYNVPSHDAHFHMALYSCGGKPKGGKPKGGKPKGTRSGASHVRGLRARNKLSATGSCNWHP